MPPLPGFDLDGGSEGRKVIPLKTAKNRKTERNLLSDNSVSLDPQLREGFGELTIFAAETRTPTNLVNANRCDLLPLSRARQGVSGAMASQFGNKHLHTHPGTRLPPSAGARNCLALMFQWERLGGGIARVSVHDSSLDGLDYTLKGSGLTESAAKRWAGDITSCQSLAVRAT